MFRIRGIGAESLLAYFEFGIKPCNFMQIIWRKIGYERTMDESNMHRCCPKCESPTLWSRAFRCCQSLVLFGGGGQLGFSLSNHFKSVVVGRFAIAGFVPELVAAIELLLGTVDVDLRGLESIVCKNGHALR